MRKSGDLLSEIPDAIQEPVRTDDSFVRPRCFFFRGSDEERVNALGIGAITLDELIGWNDVESRLRHLADLGDQLAVAPLSIRLPVAMLDFRERYPGHVVDRIAIAFLRDHSLIEEPLERLFEVDESHVE